MNPQQQQPTDGRGALPVTMGAPVVRAVDLDHLRISHARFPAGFEIPSHYHDRACVSVILEGRFEQRFPGRTCECPPGGVIAKAPGERHADSWHDVVSEHVILEPHPDRHGRFGPCRPVLESITHRVDPAALSIAWRIRRELDHGDAVTELALEALAMELLVTIYRGRGESSDSGSAPSWLSRVRDYLHDRYSERVTLDDLADVAGVHPTHVSRTFSQEFGQGMSSYLRELRLAAACHDLLATDHDLSRIALRHGFADQSHFGRILKRETGLTPAHYRSLHQEVNARPGVC